MCLHDRLLFRFAPDVGRCEDAQIDLNGDIHLTLMQSLAHSAEDRPIEPKVPALMLILIYAIELVIKNTNFRCFLPVLQARCPALAIQDRHCRFGECPFS